MTVFVGRASRKHLQKLLTVRRQRPRAVRTVDGLGVNGEPSCGRQTRQSVNSSPRLWIDLGLRHSQFHFTTIALLLSLYFSGLHAVQVSALSSTR